MKKYIKNILITTFVLALCLTCYITVDCIKLRNSMFGTKPLITLDNKITENGFKYIGLGYTIEYYYDRSITRKYDVVLIGENGYGAEFRLFGKILVWAWAE